MRMGGSGMTQRSVGEDIGRGKYMMAGGSLVVSKVLSRALHHGTSLVGRPSWWCSRGMHDGCLKATGPDASGRRYSTHGATADPACPSPEGLAWVLCSLARTASCCRQHHTACLPP